MLLIVTPEVLLINAYGFSSLSDHQELEVLEHTVGTFFPGVTMAWSCSSPAIKHHNDNAQGKVSTGEMLQKLLEQEISRVAILPLNVIPGEEYARLQDLVETMKHEFSSLTLGSPLLHEPGDMQPVAERVLQCYKDRPEHPLVLMGHGTRSSARELYGQLSIMLHKLDRLSFLALMHGEPSLDSVLEWCCREGISSVTLSSFFMVPGRHAERDMAGAGSASWKSRLESEGIEVHPVIRGLVSCPSVMEYLVEKLKLEIS